MLGGGNNWPDIAIVFFFHRLIALIEPRPVGNVRIRRLTPSRQATAIHVPSPAGSALNEDVFYWPRHSVPFFSSKSYMTARLSVSRRSLTQTVKLRFETAFESFVVRTTTV